MQGIYVSGRRAATKKALKLAAAAAPATVELEATSVFGDEYSGALDEAPIGEYYVVGPDPYVKRSWYAQIVVSADGRIRVN